MFSTRKESKTRAVARGSVLFSLLLSLLLAACSMPGANVLTHFSDFPLPNDHYLGALAAGPDGNIWFVVPAVVAGAEKIGKITPSGAITEYPLPTHNSYLQGITTGPDGNVWFTEYEGNKIGRITPTGTFTEFPVAPGGSLRGITAGPDGNLWIMEESSVVRMTPSGTITTFAKPNDDFYGGGYGGYITAGPDGNMWFIGGRPGSPPRLGRFSPNQ